MRVASIYQKVNSSNNHTVKDVQLKSVQNYSHAQQIQSLTSIYYPIINKNNSVLSFCAREYSSKTEEPKLHPGDFLLKHVKNIPCPACGSRIMTYKEYENFSQKLDNNPQENYLGILGKYQGYMRPTEKQAFEEICEVSNATGEKDLRTLVCILRNTKLVELEKIQYSRLKKMARVARTLPENERGVVLSKIRQIKTQIRSNSKLEAPFKRKKMLQEISNLDIKNPDNKRRIQAIAQSFPTSQDLDSAWIVKYSGKNKQGEPYSSNEIAKRLLVTSVGNCDHIMAYNLERGNDLLSNYFVMHQGCNNHKADNTFLDWYNEDPKLHEKSLKLYFSTVAKYVHNGTIQDDSYKDYVAKATKTIRRITSGKVDIKV